MCIIKTNHEKTHLFYPDRGRPLPYLLIMSPMSNRRRACSRLAWRTWPLAWSSTSHWRRACYPLAWTHLNDNFKEPVAAGVLSASLTHLVFSTMLSTGHWRWELIGMHVRGRATYIFEVHVQILIISLSATYCKCSALRMCSGCRSTDGDGSVHTE